MIREVRRNDSDPTANASPLQAHSNTTVDLSLRTGFHLNYVPYAMCDGPICPHGHSKSSR
jgi:hypothetical protein